MWDFCECLPENLWAWKRWARRNKNEEKKKNKQTLWKLNSIVSGGWFGRTNPVKYPFHWIVYINFCCMKYCCAAHQNNGKTDQKEESFKSIAQCILLTTFYTPTGPLWTGSLSLSLYLRVSCGWETCCAHYSGYHHHINRAYLAWHEREANTHKTPKSISDL